MFRFPVVDSGINLSGDSSFESEKAKNGDHITKALFLSGYGQFVQELELGELDSALRNLDVDKLKMTDSLGFSDSSANKECIHRYSIQIKNDSVVEFEANGYPNSGPVGRESEDSKCVEYLLDWEFAFDGKRLFMTFHSEAD